MPQLKVTWEEYQEAALIELKRQYLNLGDGVRFVKDTSYEGENDVCEYPTAVYLEIKS